MSKSFHYHHLKTKWLVKNKNLRETLANNHTDISASRRFRQHLIGGLMLASTPFFAAPSAVAAALPSPAPTPVQTQAPTISKEELVTLLKEQLPPEVRPLTTDEEEKITHILSKNLRIRVVPELSGIRLNRSYGLIGQEQHLPRFPGDSIDTHDYPSYGMTPGLGAWGYFANSKAELTNEDILHEKYYIAVQTFLTPGWNEHINDYRDFFKYRRMLLVNPENGKAIVADIADSGPAQWTGKHLGGSPEVMQFLERVDGPAKGPVLYFFIGEAGGTIPLGPINI